MTPASMLKVLDGLIHGHRLLSGSQRQQMDGNCLGWDCSLTGTASYVGKYGGIIPQAHRAFRSSSASSRGRPLW